ncbi:MAG: Rieske (2Fe-2S) protein, partial [Gammaproteobacteria bacterium]
CDVSQWFQAARVGEIEDKKSKVITLNGSDVAVFNLSGEYFAIEDVCTHDGGDISGGWVEGDRAVCPRHLAEFSIRTGEALKAPAYEGVHSFPVRVRGDLIEVCDDRVYAGTVMQGGAP